MATRSEKSAVVDAVKQSFEKAMATVFVNFEGLDVPQVTELRARFRAAGVEYRVVKNRLIKQALKGTELEGNEALNAQLKGMTGVAWSFEDPSSAAKIIKNFRKEDDENEAIKFKAGLLANEVLSADQVENELATLPGKDELRAMLLAQLMAPMQQLVMQLNAPAQNLGYVLEAIRRQQEGEG